MWCAYSKPIKRFGLAFWLCTSWIAEALYCTVRFGFWSHVRPWCRRRCSRCVCGIPSWRPNKLHWCVMITYKCTIYIHTWHISSPCQWSKFLKSFFNPHCWLLEGHVSRFGSPEGDEIRRTCMNFVFVDVVQYAHFPRISTDIQPRFVFDGQATSLI